jgi:hypothetical protein
LSHVITAQMAAAVVLAAIRTAGAGILSAGMAWYGDGGEFRSAEKRPGPAVVGRIPALDQAYAGRWITERSRRGGKPSSRRGC